MTATDEQMHHYDDHLDDAVLVALVLAGEREAFGPLLLRYYASVVRLCRQLLDSDLEAQDVAQEASLQAFLGLAQLREPERFGAWLHAIAANQARMTLRRRRLLSWEAVRAREHVAGLWAQPISTPEDAQVAREVHDAIVAALQQLSVVNREAVIGCYLEGHSYAELAELLGVPISTVKGRLFKGRQRLMQLLGPVAQEVLKPDRRQKERDMEPQLLTEVRIERIQTRQEEGQEKQIVILREEGSDRVLPIWVGAWEASSIAGALRAEQHPRPFTHDLTLRLLDTLGAQVQRVVVNKLIEQTFYAEITLVQGGQRYQVDARPSDALALAARTDAPIYVAPALLSADA